MESEFFIVEKMIIFRFGMAALLFTDVSGVFQTVHRQKNRIRCLDLHSQPQFQKEEADSGIQGAVLESHESVFQCGKQKRHKRVLFQQ